MSIEALDAVTARSIPQDAITPEFPCNRTYEGHVEKHLSFMRKALEQVVLKAPRLLMSVVSLLVICTVVAASSARLTLALLRSRCAVLSVC